MRQFLIAVVVIGLIGFVVSQWTGMLKTKNDLAARAEQQLDLVDDKSQEMVKKKLVEEARKLGVTVVPADIQVKYEDTDVRSLAQQYTAKIATFVNKRATIQISYNARFVGFTVPEKIEVFKTRQISAQSRQSSELKQVQDATP
jgi:hypothetical protein